MYKISKLILLLSLIYIPYDVYTKSHTNNIDVVLKSILPNNVFIFEKSLINNNNFIGCGVLVSQNLVLLKYSDISPKEEIIEGTNNKYSSISYISDFSNLIFTCYNNNKIDSSNFKRIHSFDKESNLVLIELEKPIGKSVRLMKQKGEYDLFLFTLPFSSYVDNFNINNIIPISFKPTDDAISINTTIFLNDIIDTINAYNNIGSYVFNNKSSLSFIYTTNSELFSTDASILDSTLHNKKTDKVDLNFAHNNFKKEYLELLNKNNGHLFEQFYIKEKYDILSQNFKQRIIYNADIHFTILKNAVGKIKKFEYLNNINEYNSMVENINYGVNVFSSSTLKEEIANDIQNLNLKIVAKNLYNSLYYDKILTNDENGSLILNNNSYKSYQILLNVAHNLYNENYKNDDVINILNKIANESDDWKIKSEAFIRLSYIEIVHNKNFTSAKTFYNLANSHSFEFYHRNNKILMDINNYILKELK